MAESFRELIAALPFRIAQEPQCEMPVLRGDAASRQGRQSGCDLLARLLRQRYRNEQSLDCVRTAHPTNLRSIIMSTGCVVANVRPDLGRTPRDENPVGYGRPMSLHDMRHAPGFAGGLPRGNGEPEAQAAVRGKSHVKSVFAFKKVNAASRGQTRKSGTDV